MISKKFQKYDNFIFDLDGTLWKWTKAIPGASKIIKELYKEGKKLYFNTNNTALTRSGFAKKLRGFGIPAEESQIVNPTLVAIRLFKGKRVFVSGEGIIDDLKKAGVKVVQDNADAVLITEDRSVDHKKMTKAAQLVIKGASLYKTARGGRWPYGDTVIIGVGAIAKAVEECARKEAVLIGKPTDYMLDVIKRLKLNKSKTLIVGDEFRTDVVMGHLLGMDTLLVLSGNTTKKDALSATGMQKPKYLLNSVADIIE